MYTALAWRTSWHTQPPFRHRPLQYREEIDFTVAEVCQAVQRLRALNPQSPGKSLMFSPGSQTGRKCQRSDPKRRSMSIVLTEKAAVK